MIFDLETVKCFNLNLLFIFSAFLLSVKRYSIYNNQGLDNTPTEPFNDIETRNIH